MSAATKHTYEDGTSLLASIVGALSVIPNIFFYVSRAQSAAHAFERLNHLSDSELAARGLTRDGLGKHICDEYLSN